MRSTFVRRTVLAASAASLALLATACSSGSSDSKEDTKAGASAPAAASPSAAAAAKGKTDAELAGLIVAQADLPDHVVKAATPTEVAEAASSTSDKPDCVPLVKVQSFAPVGKSTGAARTKAVAKPKAPDAGASPEDKAKAAMNALGSTATAVTIASYEGKGAEEAFAALKTAGTACAGGYGVTAGGETSKVSKVAAGAPVTAGDAALAYTVEGDADGTTFSTQVVVVRKGNTLATFSAVSLSGTAEQPKAVVDAQVKKLG